MRSETVLLILASEDCRMVNGHSSTGKDGMREHSDSRLEHRRHCVDLHRYPV